MKIELPARVQHVHGDGRMVRAEVLIAAGTAFIANDVTLSLLVNRSSFAIGDCVVSVEQADCDPADAAFAEAERIVHEVEPARELSAGEKWFLNT